MTTASEKLREMSRFEGENHWREQIDERLAAALPQIVAVVEAAEAEALYSDGQYDLTERVGGELGRSLAALEEALG